MGRRCEKSMVIGKRSSNISLRKPLFIPLLHGVFPTEHSLRTRTQVRHKCTQVHNGKRSSKLAKSISVPLGAAHLSFREETYESEVTDFVASQACACMRLLSRHRPLGSFSVKLISILKFSKGPTWTLNALQLLPHSPKMPKDRNQRKSYKLDRTMNDSL